MRQQLGLDAFAASELLRELPDVYVLLGGAPPPRGPAVPLSGATAALVAQALSREARPRALLASPPVALRASLGSRDTERKGYAFPESPGRRSFEAPGAIQWSAPPLHGPAVA